MAILTTYITCRRAAVLRDNKRRIYIMAYVIGDDCQDCGACAAVCPAEAISEGDGKYVIDADACLDCGTCEAECPHGAISAE